MPFGWCPCALFIELSSLHLRKHVTKKRDLPPHSVAPITYMYNPSESQLQTHNRKIHCKFVGPLAIYKCISPNQFLLISLDGVLYPIILEEARLKPGLIPTHKGPVRTLSELKDAAKIVFRTQPQLHCVDTKDT